MLDHRKLIAIVKETPSIWDRSHPLFRDKEAKETKWEEIGQIMGTSATNCREAFKSIREKYIRERDKAHQLGENYREWELLSHLTFLDPNIVPRKQSFSSEEDMQAAEEFRNRISLDSLTESNPTDFDRTLVNLVRQTTPIWDRNCNTYPNKQLKLQLWDTIAQKLNRPVNYCMLRWKALREKYIRQKTKFQEAGLPKWDLLDDMSFLDKVILYRRKTSDYGRDINVNNYLKISDGNDTDSSSHLVIDTTATDDNSSSDDFLSVVKVERTTLQMADSSFHNNTPSTNNSNNFNLYNHLVNPAVGNLSNFRKRSASVSINNPNYHQQQQQPQNNSDNGNIDIVEKRLKTEDISNEATKSPEQLFGDLVAAILSKKPEKERSLIMVEIMTVLSK